MSEERVILDERGCRLTDRRFIAPDGATYLLSHITSVRLIQEQRKGGCAALGVTLFLFMLGMANLRSEETGIGPGGAVLCLVLAGAMVWYWASRPINYTLILVTAGGEQSAVTATNRDFMVELRDKLTDALAARED